MERPCIPARAGRLRRLPYAYGRENGNEVERISRRKRLPAPGSRLQPIEAPITMAPLLSPRLSASVCTNIREQSRSDALDSEKHGRQRSNPSGGTRRGGEKTLCRPAAVGKSIFPSPQLPWANFPGNGSHGHEDRPPASDPLLQPSIYAVRVQYGLPDHLHYTDPDRAYLHTMRTCPPQPDRCRYSIVSQVRRPSTLGYPHWANPPRS